MLASTDVTLSATAARMGAGTHRRGASCVVLAARSPGGAPRAWIGCDTAAALPGLGRKLPHYSRWSFLVFDGTAPTIRARGRWRVDDSPLQTRFVPLADLPPLTMPATPMLDASAPP